MSSYYECDVCGLTEGDLPDGVDGELVFDRNGLVTFCIVHSDSELAAAAEIVREATCG